MAPKNKSKGRRRRSKTPGQTSASDPNPTAPSPSDSSPTGDATTTSLVPSSASQITTTQRLPSPPLLPVQETNQELISCTSDGSTTTTTLAGPSAAPSTSAPPQPTSILPSSASQITTTQQPLPSPPPPALPVQETHQELISCTSEGSTTPDLAGPSTAPSASSATTRTPTLLPITDEFVRLFCPAIAGAITALQCVRVEDQAELREKVVALCGLQLDEMELVIGYLLGLTENMEFNVALDALHNMGVLRRAVKVTEMLLAERKKRHGSGGSCGGSKGGGGGPDSGSGEGDGEGGGV